MISDFQKKCIKVSIALALAFGFTLKIEWLNPYWAGFAVCFISIVPDSQSFGKGILRLWGTLLGGAGALLILSLAPQQRWLFGFLISVWIFVTTFLMNFDPRRSYMWNVTGFTCMIITLAGAGDSAQVFLNASFRLLDTFIGVICYSFVMVIIWPETNMPMIQVLSKKVEGQIYKFYQNTMKDGCLKKDQLEIFNEYSTSIYQMESGVHMEKNPLIWTRHQRRAWMHIIAAYHEIYAHISVINSSEDDLSEDGKADLMDLDDLFYILNHLDYEDKSTWKRQEVQIDMDWQKQYQRLQRLVYLIKKIINYRISIYSRDHCHIPAIEADYKYYYDQDSLKGSLWAGICTFIAFGIWIFIDPPGHNGWYQLISVSCMVIANVRVVNCLDMIKPSLIVGSICILLTVFVLPNLHNVWAVLFLIALVNYIIWQFFKGMALIAAMLSLLMLLPIHNEQSYDIASLLNNLLYNILAYLTVDFMSRFLNCHRTEKEFVKLVNRFYKAYRHVVLFPNDKSWRKYYYFYEIKTIPKKLFNFSKGFIYQQKFQADVENINALISGIKNMSIHIADFQKVNRLLASDIHKIERLDEDMKKLRNIFSELIHTKIELDEEPELRPLQKYREDLISSIKHDEPGLSTMDYKQIFLYQSLGSMLDIFQQLKRNISNDCESSN